MRWDLEQEAFAMRQRYAKDRHSTAQVEPPPDKPKRKRTTKQSMQYTYPGAERCICCGQWFMPRPGSRTCGLCRAQERVAMASFLAGRVQ